LAEAIRKFTFDENLMGTYITPTSMPSFYAKKHRLRHEKPMHHQPCLLLIRHAQSENNALEDQFRVPDPDITDLGSAQSKKLAAIVAKLSPTVLYCSPFRRSLETTRWIALQTGTVPSVRQDIYEQGGCHSGYQPGRRIAHMGTTRQTLSQQYSGWHLDERISDQGWYDLDHYETADEARQRAQRVRKWYESETQLHSNHDRVAMVIHADFKMRLLEAFLEDYSIQEQLGDSINTSITRLSLAKGRWRMDYWNSFSHLDPHEISC